VAQIHIKKVLNESNNILDSGLERQESSRVRRSNKPGDLGERGVTSGWES
jgi:hypothetical protein